jgi:SAM-dependent methyltransferase
LTLQLRFRAPAEDYLGRLSRLRWRRAFADVGSEIRGTLEVIDECSLPAPGSGPALAAAVQRNPGRAIYPLDSAGAGISEWRAPAVSTLRELERACPPIPSEDRRSGEAPAWPPARFMPDEGGEGVAIVATGFRVVRAPQAFGAREEIVSRVPPGSARLLDVGCGEGATAEEARRRFPALRVEGIDRRASFGGAACAALDAFHFGDALEIMEKLGQRDELFDVLVFADSLEHFEDPFRVMDAARRLATPAATVIVSVPNAAGASIVADLVAGRFDPIGAGPEDAGHLRWFTLSSLRELLEGSGFSEVTCDPLPAPGDGAFLSRLESAGVSFDENQLAAIQWVATAKRT